MLFLVFIYYYSSWYNGESLIENVYTEMSTIKGKNVFIILIENL